MITKIQNNPQGEWKIEVPLPPSVNNAYLNARKGRVQSQKTKKWYSIAKNSIFFSRSKYGDPRAISPPYLIVYELYRPDKRIRDCANYEKLLSDLLVKYEVITDDSDIACNVQFWSEGEGEGVVGRIWSLAN